MLEVDARFLSSCEADSQERLGSPHVVPPPTCLCPRPHYVDQAPSQSTLGRSPWGCPFSLRLAVRGHFLSWSAVGVTGRLAVLSPVQDLTDGSLRPPLDKEQGRLSLLCTCTQPAVEDTCRAGRPGLPAVTTQSAERKEPGRPLSAAACVG